MQVLTSSVDLGRFFERVQSAPERVLMLDYDGTLAPFHVRPERAVPYPQVAAALREVLDAGGTRVVIVSGRPARDLPPLLALEPTPEIWGVHGWERLLPDGSFIVEEPSAEARRVLSEALSIARGLTAEGARIEEKMASIALHWRGLPDEVGASLAERAAAAWEPLARSGAVEILPFDCGLELRASGCNKQTAVKSVLSQTSEASAVAYLGDDVTDEDAFRAVKPRGLGVLVRPDFRQTDADVWIRPPEELLDFILRWRVGGKSA